MPFRTPIPNLPNRTDAELCLMLRRSKADSERAFKELYGRYASRIHAYCYKIVENKEEAEDLFQETFVRFYLGMRQDRELTNVAGYLFRIARNLCLNRLRDRPGHASIDGLELPMAIDRSLEDNELLGLIAAAVELLEMEFREAFILREYENMPYEQIADLTGTSLTNAKSRVFRARQKIRKLLEPSIKELD